MLVAACRQYNLQSLDTNTANGMCCERTNSVDKADLPIRIVMVKYVRICTSVKITFPLCFKVFTSYARL
jgi:hypothetical protein